MLVICAIFIVQTDNHNINRDQLLVRYSNIIVPNVSMLLKCNWSIFSSILEPINSKEYKAFSGFIFPVFNVFQQN